MSSSEPSRPAPLAHGSAPAAGWARSRGPWLVLAVPLLVLGVLAVTASRRDWPSVVGDEATYLMAAQSLAYDFDLRYRRADYDRFTRRFGVPPEGLILQSPDGGRTLVFGKPLFYPLVIAPFVRLGGLPGARLANVLWLALASAAAAWALAPRLGRAAAPWVAVLVFGSVLFSSALWVHADLFYAGCVALALALVYRPRDGERLPRARFDPRCAAALCLLVVVTIGRPFYAPLLLPVLLHAGVRDRSILRLVLPAAAVCVVAVAFDLQVRGTYSAYAGERQGYYSYTGFPEVDLEHSWRDTLAERGPNSWVGRFVLPHPFDLRRFLWDTIYFSLGRHVGLLPYFLPALGCLLLYRPGGGRTVLLAAVALTVAAFLVVRPFNFWGGGGAIGNRYFLPLYPACWFLIGRRPGRTAWVAVSAFAALFLHPLWARPGMFPRGPDHGYAFVSPLARRALPYETTQNQLKPGGGEDLVHNGLWLKPLAPGMAAWSVPGQPGDWLRWRPGAHGALLVGAEQRVGALLLCAADAQAAARVGAWRISGSATATLPVLGRPCCTLPLGRPRARHPMWWTRRDFTLYTLHIAAPTGAPIDLSLAPAAEGGSISRRALKPK